MTSPAAHAGEPTNRATPAKGNARRPKRSVMLLFAAATALVALEAVLQLGSFVVWLRQRPVAAPIPPGQEVALCVGDSWTHGMGSSDPARHSYPAVLQQLLRDETGRDWVVVNGGLSGQNSRDVLQRLPSQLAEFRPRIVCVLVGQNDFWSVPEELGDDFAEEALDHGAYQFRWRIPRLLAWVKGKLTGFDTLAAVRVDARGPEWQTRVVRAKAPYESEPRKWRVGGVARVHQREGWRLAEANDVPGAIRQFELALTACEDDPVTRAALAGLHQRNGRPAEAAVHLQWLEDSWRRDSDYWTGSCLARALSDCGKNQQALDLAKAALERFPDDGQLWRLRAQSELFVGLVDEASRSIERAIQLGPDPFAWYWRHKICFLGRGDGDEAIRSLLHAYVVFNDARRAADDLRALDRSGLGPRLRPVLDDFDCPPDVKLRLGTILDEIAANSDGAGARRVLEAHLRRIAAAVRAAEAVPVFLCYPTPMPAEEVLRAVAAELGVKFLEVSAGFQRRLAPRSWEEVRAPDGHCNDDGYRLMAEVVADDLRAVVR